MQGRFFRFQRACAGFTLAELLVAVSILGVIAAFTVPSVINAQQASTWNSGAKNFANMLQGAYANYSYNNQPVSGTNIGNITPYMNYVQVVSTGGIDRPSGGTVACQGGSGNKCLQLHDGGMIRYATGYTLGGTSTTDALFMYYDPTGVSGDGSKGVEFWLYYDGTVLSDSTIKPNTYDYSGGLHNPNSDGENDPNWFSWTK